jgi:hypothetical protein
LLGHRKAILFLEKIIPLISREKNSTMTYGCWLGKAFELAFEFGEDRP